MISRVMAVVGAPVVGDPSFDTVKLDALMEQAGVDALIVSSRHNVRYVLGSYSLFFEHFDAIGIDRYMPAVGYVRGRLDQAFSVMSPLERSQFELAAPWTATVTATSWG